MQRYGFWKDKHSGMICGKIDVHPLRGFTELMIHKQYFYEDYPHCESDYKERILAGCCWCYEHGYQGAFVEEAIEN